MKARFRGLRIIALVSKGFAWVSLIAGIVLASLTAAGSYYIPILLPAAPFSSTNLIGAALTLIPFLVWFLFLYSAGAILEVLIAIEKNTRRVKGRDEVAPAHRANEAESGFPEGL